MENGIWRPWTGYVPTPEEIHEHNGSKASLPQVDDDGWYMAEYPSGKSEVMHVRKVVWFGRPRLEFYYDADNGPVYDDGYYAPPRMRPIAQDTALAWYARNNVTPPAIREDGGRVEESGAGEHQEEEDVEHVS
jgi:hypothetical protein